MEIAISSNAEKVLRQVQGLPTRMVIAIARAMDTENELTVGHIQSTYLTGPRPTRLGVVTNRLRGSIRPSKAVIEGDTVSSTIGTNVVYARAHEFGFAQGIVRVRTHTRRQASGNVRAATAVFDSKTGKIRNARPRTVASGITTVRSYSRLMKMPARPFLAPGLADRAASYGQAISGAIIAAWSEGGTP